MTNASGQTFSNVLDIGFYNELEAGDNDDYYFYEGSGNYTQANITYIRLKMSGNRLIRDPWKCKKFTVYINGIPKVQQPQGWFNKTGDSSEFRW
jgi:hypothetical protein